MRVILLGSPGSGKGTQAQNISKRYHIPQISTGDMLRAVVKTDSPRAEQFRQIMQSGMLVSDELILELVDERVKEPDCYNGYLLDGFPRTIPQAEAIQARGIEIDYIIEIDVADAEIIKRLSGRRVHVNSGRIYHLDYNPPIVSGKDDITGEPLIQRADDQEDTIRKRLEVYHQQTQPLVEFYQNLAKQPNSKLKFATIPGVGNVGEISRKIFNLLGEP